MNNQNRDSGKDKPRTRRPGGQDGAEPNRAQRVPRKRKGLHVNQRKSWAMLGNALKKSARKRGNDVCSGLSYVILVGRDLDLHNVLQHASLQVSPLRRVDV